MKPITMVVLVTVLVLVAMVLETVAVQEDGHDMEDDYEGSMESSGTGRALLQKKRTRRSTCRKQPRICLARGSPGPNCCKKKCVNLLSNRMNCGKCGRKCKYNQICCNGKCINPSFNSNHCGGCNSGCQNGEFCVLGLCNYA